MCRVYRHSERGSFSARSIARRMCSCPWGVHGQAPQRRRTHVRARKHQNVSAECVQSMHAMWGGTIPRRGNLPAVTYRRYQSGRTGVDENPRERADKPVSRS